MLLPCDTGTLFQLLLFPSKNGRVQVIAILYAIVLFFTFVKFSIGLDTLFPNQTIVLGQTLISSNQMFVMGFFSTKSSKNRYLGVWYKDTPNVVVWVANRNDPITSSQGLHVSIVGNNSLAIMTAGSVIWSSNPSWVASNPILRLLDTGNLVLACKTNRGLSQSYIWQSFDHPTDTFLPGMNMVKDVHAGAERYLTSWKNFDDPSTGDIILKIQNQALPNPTVFKGLKKIYRSGTWNGLHFSGCPPFDDFLVNYEMVFKDDKLISMSMPYNNSSVRRMKIDKSGSIQHLILNARKDKWNAVQKNPEHPCEEYGKCGPFGICVLGTGVRCLCFKGFAPKSPNDWYLQDWSGGCTRITPLTCQNRDHGFLEVSGTNYPDILNFQFNTNMSLHECKATCLKDCSCIAYANPYIGTGASGCLMWFGELIDTRYLASQNKQQNFYIRLPYSELDSGPNSRVGEKKTKLIMFILISIISGVLVSCIVNGGSHFLARKIRSDPTRKYTSADLELPLYKSIIMTATNNFSMENLIGEGGFGPVYLGNLPTQLKVAIKRLSANSQQGLEEFRNDASLIAKLQHRNLVRLLGCCIEREEKILIYEYLQNKSLDTFVFDQNRRTLLTWPTRFDIILGIARGILYLHHDSRLKVVHRDLKMSNILLDDNMNPKISDFGIARIFEDNQSSLRTKRVIGTFGYMSPEYIVAGKFSTKSDIFSLGVVLLEIVSGRKNRGFVSSNPYDSFLGHAWSRWKENKTLELVDDCLMNTTTYVESQMKRCVQVALLCVQKDIEDRPDMISVCSMLTTDEAILPEPKEPGFFIHKSQKTTAKSYICTAADLKNGTMAITDLEGR